jgi:hypothetical protein
MPTNRSVSQARTGLVRFLNFYNTARSHSGQEGKTPDQVYFNLKLVGGIAPGEDRRVESDLPPGPLSSGMYETAVGAPVDKPTRRRPLIGQEILSK